jgi:hypothetical protein
MQLREVSSVGVRAGMIRLRRTGKRGNDTNGSNPRIKVLQCYCPMAVHR